MSRRKVVLALDPASEEANYTVEWIIENFLKPEKDDVYLVSALPLTSDFEATELGMNINYAAEYIMNWEKEIEQKTRDSLQEYVNKLQLSNISVTLEIVKSKIDTSNVIVDYTEQMKADVLIMGSRDLSTWKRLFVGSFSDYCQQHAHCPVLIVKSRRT
ncbi:1319_t:CDS:2 [Ambispora leptoticha]|uniref:1319_t:CDS:1 n=1 Tax=Ambispora leptoticha TaxID=144679 RepID=A0A9N9F7H7_9GLOM|nr:1319_t:CDS:2 [Ambispora leptoticha]